MIKKNGYNQRSGAKIKDEACSFNFELAKKTKPKLLSLLNKLYEMINKLNDGSFEIENRIQLFF